MTHDASNYLTNFIDECKRAERHLRDVFGKDLPDEVIYDLIPKAVRILREDALERQAIAISNAIKRQP